MTSTVDRTLPSSAAQLWRWSRPTTTTRLPWPATGRVPSLARETTTASNAGPAQVVAQGWATTSRTITAYSSRPSTVTQ
jgi:hypothetical protein